MHSARGNVVFLLQSIEPIYVRSSGPAATRKRRHSYIRLIDLVNDVSIMSKPSFTSYASSSWAWIAAAALVFCCAHSIYVPITCWCARMASSGGQDRQSAADWPFPAVSAGSLLAPSRWLHVCFAAAPPCARARCCFHSTATRTAVNARAH